MSTPTVEYLKLINKFALAPVETGQQNDEALLIIRDLTKRENSLTAAERSYFKILISLVREFENKTYSGSEYVPPLEMLAYLMEENNLKQTDVCKATGIEKSNLSAILKGTRKLGREDIGRLAKFFSVSPLLFVEDDFFGGVSLSSAQSDSLK
ncbi:MAG: helix-turn-helix domain-containing protein [Candidatus Obscuribacterales bacterium]|jgi:HTH-type transcriptional regulator / antitoxin HigA|nr:helix-turn-helix domain-containing protein [Candidatus Obscuribacterales bacterium]